MEYICIEILETGERRKIDRPIFITTNRNGIVTTPHWVKAQGVGDGAQIWSLGKLEGYPRAKKITLAEYLEGKGADIDDSEVTATEALHILLGGNYETE